MSVTRQRICTSDITTYWSNHLLIPIVPPPHPTYHLLSTARFHTSSTSFPSQLNNPVNPISTSFHSLLYNPFNAITFLFTIYFQLTNHSIRQDLLNLVMCKNSCMCAALMMGPGLKTIYVSFLYTDIISIFINPNHYNYIY